LSTRTATRVRSAQRRCRLLSHQQSTAAITVARHRQRTLQQSLSLLPVTTLGSRLHDRSTNLHNSRGQLAHGDGLIARRASQFSRFIVLPGPKRTARAVEGCAGASACTAASMARRASLISCEGTLMQALNSDMPPAARTSRSNTPHTARQRAMGAGKKRPGTSTNLRHLFYVDPNMGAATLALAHETVNQAARR
jgi:hypothetical protein